tara:strand:- start:2347 stop:2676 length:330 start_codon:yes stop_codon:yes gene_type:complete
MYETVISARVESSINMLVPFYLMCSYAYYVEDDGIVSDAYYDNMSKQLLKEYDNIQHMHLALISKDMLIAGSFLGEYPSIISGAVKHFRRRGLFIQALLPQYNGKKHNG